MMFVGDMCNKKRLALSAAIFTLVVIVTVALRSHWSYTAQLEQQLLAHKAKANSSCGTLQLTVLRECVHCQLEELRNEEPYCMETGFKEWVRCADGREVYNWCDITPAVEERTFWIFELCTFIIGAASYTVVYLRQRKNDQLLMDKINRQIGLTT